jgi:putative two-component system response regulator
MLNNHHPKILIIDDLKENIELISQILYNPEEPYQIITANNGYDAIKKVNEISPDLIILDVVMPGLNGFEVCKKLKSDHRTRLIPVVMITALGSQKDRIKGLEVGVDDFLSKPFNIYELIARVKNLLKLHSYISELEHAEQVIFSLARAVEAKDNYTEGHCERLSYLAQRIGLSLGMNEHDMIILKRGGILHDIGKIAIQDSILLKPGPLTPDEFLIVKTHPEVGENICRPLRSLQKVLPVIRHHQERHNGSGYPDGLKGSEIPIHARIIGIVDCFDALTTERTYRKALPSKVAIEIIDKEMEDGLWDPELVKILKSIVKDKGFKKWDILSRQKQ